MKNTLAPLVCKIRSPHPKFTSRAMCLTLAKARDTSAPKCIDKNKPVKICVTRHTRSKEPKFHQYDRLAGIGVVTTALSMIFKRCIRFWGPPGPRFIFIFLVKTGLLFSV